MESLPPGHLSTGKRLHEDIETLKVFHRDGLEVELREAPTRGDFLACLADVQKDAERHAKYPILHIECHGANDTTGLVLADGSFVSWRELKPILTEINVATRCNLLIVLAACHGGHLVQIIQLTERAPCWGMLGPASAVRPGNLLCSFSAFYSELLTSLDGDRALKALLRTSQGSGNYYFTTAERFFKIAYAAYLRNDCSPEVLQDRAKFISRELKKMKARKRPGKGSLRRVLKRKEKPFFENHFQHFFMIDLFPENVARFNVPFEEVKSLARTNTSTGTRRKRRAG